MIKLRRYGVTLIFRRTGYEYTVVSRHFTFTGAQRRAERQPFNPYVGYRVRPL